ISYVIGGAGWQPEYDVDVSPRGRGKTGPAGARLTVGALIHQATGEDWNNVRVLLSTARPKLGAEAPQPAPLVIDGYEQKRDKELKVERQTRDDKDQSARFLSSTKHIVRGYRNKLTNRANGPETIELRENVPVSKIDDVKVEVLGASTTPGYQLDAARGFITW